MPKAIPSFFTGSSLVSRRDVLQVGSLAVAASLAPQFAQAATRKKAKSVIFLWMAGGVTHHESFDPKPDAPEEIRGTLKAIQTKLPGVRFSEVMPCLAMRADQLAVIRTYSSGNDDHFRSQAAALSGRDVTPAQITTEPNIGAILSKMQGPRAGFPGYIAVPGTTRPGPPPKNLFVGGWLGERYSPFLTGGKAKNEDFTAGVAEENEEAFTMQAVEPFQGLNDNRLAARRSLRERLDDRLGEIEGASEIGNHFSGAFNMLMSPTVRDAFDFVKETPSTRDRYGRTKIGNRILLARRLVEAGAPFVMVDYGYDPEYGNLWDQHNATGQNFPHICEMAQKPWHLAGLDRAVAALLDDLRDRGTLDETLVVLHTDFGRTPKINKNGGRDHWGKAGSIFFAGGGTNAGQVIGSTDAAGGYPTSPAYSPGDVAATIYSALGIDRSTMLPDRQNRPIAILPEGEPIPGVLT